MSATWMVRAGRGGAQVDDFLDQGVVSIDFEAAVVGELPADVDKAEILARLRQAHPGTKPGRLQARASQVFRFYAEIAVGDRVVTSDPGQRRFLLGEVTSEPRFVGERHCRSVRWTHRVPRSALGVASLNSLGSILTLFLVPEEVVVDMDAHKLALDAPPETDPVLSSEDDQDQAAVAVLMEDAVVKAESFLEDQLNRLDPHDMEELVAGILRAMGYKTRVSPRGADRGVDVFASPDGLGLEEPRIFVEVKHRKAAMGSQEIRSFLGGRKSGDRCLYVSTGGFSREARYEADRANVPLTLLDLPALRELLVEQYESLDTEARQLVPLKRVYWPVPTD